MRLAGRKTQIIISLELLFSISLILFVALPSWQNVSVTKESILERRLSLQDTEQLSERSNDILLRSSELDEKIDVLKTRLLRPGNALDFLTTIEDIAAQNSVTLDIHTYEQPSDPRQRNGDLSLTVTGNFQNTMRFLHQLERLNWLLQVNNLSVTPGTVNTRTQNNSEENATVTAQLLASTFWEGTL